MTALMIISDDFTGALDTGVHFAQGGVSVQISTIDRIENNGLAQNTTSVFVVNVETRHLTPKEAYTLTRSLVEKAVDAGIAHIYIKTDSGLRGNIGSGLKAALDNGWADFIPFVPAFPDMKRITCRGIHLINQVPVHMSVFGQDPFEPVRSPFVKDVFKGIEVSVETLEITDIYDTCFERPTIGIFDAETNEDMHRIARHLQAQGQLKIAAGCAGFAQVLKEYIGLPEAEIQAPVIDKPLFVICGSLNLVSRSQIEYAQKNGFCRIELAPEQILDEAYFLSPEGQQWMDSFNAMIHSNQPIVMDTGISHQDMVRQYMDQHRISKDAARGIISRSLGILVRQLLEKRHDHSRTLMVIGGDTFTGLSEQIDWQEIYPVCELAPGTVVTDIRQKDRTIRLVLKSGGFGEADLYVRLAEEIEATEAMEESPCPVI